MVSKEDIEKFRKDPQAYAKECKRLAALGRKKHKIKEEKKTEWEKRKNIEVI